MSFGDLIVMPLEAVEDLYGDHGDNWRAIAREVCRKHDARLILKNQPDDPANRFLCAVRNELDSPATPSIPAPSPIVRAIRRLGEMASVEIVIVTDTGMELRFCPNRPQEGAYTDYFMHIMDIHHAPGTGRTVEVADLSPHEGVTPLSGLSRCRVLAERSAEDGELLLSKLAPYRFGFCVVTLASGQHARVWLVGINQFSHDELTDGALPVDTKP